MPTLRDIGMSFTVLACIVAVAAVFAARMWGVEL